MKKIIFSAAMKTFVAAIVLVGCQNTTKNEDAAQNNVEDARANLDEAKEELSNARKAATQEEWQAFKETTNATITQNEMKIAEMKAKMRKAGKTLDDRYSQKIIELEQKNEEIKLKVEKYKNDAGDDWMSFKEEYNRDVAELSKAIKNLTVDNN